jgi:hypothetical protein
MNGAAKQNTALSCIGKVRVRVRVTGIDAKSYRSCDPHKVLTTQQEVKRVDKIFEDKRVS